MKSDVRARLLGLALILGSLACAGPRSETLPAAAAEPELADLGNLSRCFLADGVYVCSEPDGDALELAARRGVDLVIDLRAPSGIDVEGVDLARAARDLGLHYEHAPLRSELMDDAQVDRVLAFLSDPVRGQVLVFCENGAKSAMLFAIYRAVTLDVSIEAALEDARRAGMKPGASENQVRRQIARLQASAAISASSAIVPAS
jgi:uncharacterized protein (TIGR01244 family)